MSGSDEQVVYVLGYDPRLHGGVTGMIGGLIGELHELCLLPILGHYGKPVRSLIYTLRAFTVLVLRLVVVRPGIAVLVIASPGDVVRTLPFMALLKVFKVKIVLYYHKDLPNILVFGSWLARIARSTWAAADRLVFLSNRLAHTGTVYGLPRDKMVVISNGLEATWLASYRPAMVERTVDVAFFGRWSPEKGVNDLQRLFSEEKLGGRYCCHVYGANRPDELNGNFAFHGWCDGSTILRAVQNTKVIVLPSYSEAYPTILLEASAMGTPFVSTSIAGIPDIAKESKSGFVVEPGDVEAMSSAIQKVLDDPGCWEYCSASGYAWAQNQTVSLMAQRWRQLLSDFRESYSE